MKMTLEELEESLSEILPNEFEIKITSKGVVIYTNLKENQYGDLVSVDEDDDSYDEESDFDDEELSSLEEMSESEDNEED